MPLKIYLDASYGGDQNRTVVAGYSGREQDFLSVEERWRNLLAIDDLKEFHVVDIKHKYRNWGPVVQKYAEVLTSAPIYGIIASVDNSAFNNRSSHDVYRDNDLYRRPQYIALDLVLTAISKCIVADQPTNQVFIYTDNDYGKAERATEIFRAWEGRNSVQFGGFEVFPDGAAKKCVRIQFADLLANAYRTDNVHWSPISSLTAEMMNFFAKSPYRNVAILAWQERLTWVDR